MVDTMGRIGFASCGMVTDQGQPHNPTPVQALSDFIGEVLAEGVAEQDVRAMLASTPRQLLNL